MTELKTYTKRTFRASQYYERLTLAQRREFDVMSSVMHFKTNNHVLENLIDWDRIPDDPIYNLNFPRRGLISTHDYDLLDGLFRAGGDDRLIQGQVNRIRLGLLPPRPTAGSMTPYLPTMNDAVIRGAFHQFPDVIELVPVTANSCHAYCSYCFRWMQFVIPEIRSSYSDAEALVPYIESKPEITDVLITGADSMTMSIERLREFVDPLLKIESVRNIRLATKALAWWPRKFTTDTDADELLSYFEYIEARGKHVAVMAHFTHPRELDDSQTRRAIKRIQNAGATIYSQCPLVKHVNDAPATLASLWRNATLQGVVPFYLFLDSDYSASDYFKIPIGETLEIVNKARSRLTGLAQTIRGPVMAANHMKTLVDGIISIGDTKKLVLKCLRAPNPDKIGNITLVDYDETMTSVTITQDDF